MKAKISYKSKRIAIITAIILVLISGISIGTYFFIKGNDESSATEEANNTIQVGNNIEDNKPDENNSNIAENSTLENAENNDNKNGIANNANSVENGNTNGNQNNSNNNTNNQLPEEEYTQIDYVETGKKILVSEELSVGWSKFNLNNANISTDIEVNRPELEFNKIAKINSISEKDNAVQVGSKITYEITVKNNSKEVDAKNVTVTDSIPKGTKLDEETPISNGGVFSDGKITWNVDVNKNSEVKVSFTVVVEENQGDIKNVAIGDGTETEETVNPIIVTKKTLSSEENIEELRAGSKIKYTIKVTNQGESTAKTTVSDVVPEGTTLVEGSVTGIDENDIDIKDNKITWNNVELNPKEEAILTFEVTVNEFEGASKIIKNVALVGDTPTNEVEVPVYNPVINSNKTSNKTAVAVGEEIEYTITATNIGKVDGIAVIKDTIPQGTTFVESSIKVNDEARVDLTAEDLANGIEINVTKNGGKATVSFKVTVNEGMQGSVVNKAKVNDKETPETKNPVISFNKTVDKTEVKAGEKLLYTITVKNTGDVLGTATIKDTIPEGTTFVEGSIKIDGNSTKFTSEDLKNGIKVEVLTIKPTVLTFEVLVLGDNRTVIENKATVNDEPTNEITTKKVTDYRVEHYYNGELKEENTDNFYNLPIGTVIKEYTLKEENNFKFVDDQGNPLTLVDEISKNVIRVYYETPVITATKTSNIPQGKKLQEGEPVIYTITVKNTGNVTGNVVVTDQIPEGLIYNEYNSVKIGENDTITSPNSSNENTLTWDVKDLVKDEERTITITATVGKVDGYKEITNTVKIDGNPTDETTIVVDKPELEISKSAETELDKDDNGAIIPGQNPNEAEVGDKIVYTITVKNKSDLKADVNVSDTLPSEVKFDTSTPILVNGKTSSKAKYEDGKVTYNGKLEENKTIKITFKVIVKEGTTVGTKIRNIAIVNNMPTNETETNVVKKVCVTTTAQTMNSLDLVLVLDTSGSMSGSKLTNLKAAAKNLADRVFSEETDSTITVVTYATDINYETKKYSYVEKKQLISRINKLEANGGTNIYKALKETNSVIGGMNSVNRNRVVVFLTDGAPTFYYSNKTEEELVETNKSNYSEYVNNLRPQILKQAEILKKQKNTTVYAVGLGVNDLNTKIQYVEEKNDININLGDGEKIKNKITYRYFSTKSYAKYLLNNIASGGKYIETTDLDSTFDDILSKQTTSKHIYDAKEMPLTITIPETRKILDNKVIVKIGDSGKSITYTLEQLIKGVNGLKYTNGVGFTWTITDSKTLDANLYISYKAKGLA